MELLKRPFALLKAFVIALFTFQYGATKTDIKYLQNELNIQFTFQYGATKTCRWSYFV